LPQSPLDLLLLLLQEGLQKIRKQLVVRLGCPQPDATEVSPSGSDVKDVNKGPMFRKFFQAQDEEEEEGDEGVPVPEPGDILPEVLWAQVGACWAFVYAAWFADVLFWCR
jgi:hypothetical protein